MWRLMLQRYSVIAADKVVKDAAFAHQISQPLWKGSFRSPVPFCGYRLFWNPAHVQRRARQHSSGNRFSCAFRNSRAGRE